MPPSRTPLTDAPTGIDGAPPRLGLTRYRLSDEAHFVDYAAVLGMVSLLVLGGAGTIGLRVNTLYQEWTGTLVETLRSSSEVAP